MEPANTLSHRILDALDALHIPYTLRTHPAVYTMEDVEALGIDTGTRSVKNLFLKDKHHFFLVALPAEKKLDTKALRHILGCGNLSFAGAGQLEAQLGVQAGAVSPLAIAGDQTGEIPLILDQDLQPEDLLALHPGVNTASVYLTTADLLRYTTLFPNPVWRMAL